MTERVPVHVVMSTHTTRHLARALLALACQSRRADSVIVSCDNDHADVRDLVRDRAEALGLPIDFVSRPHQGIARLSQVRNNAIRALRDGGADPSAMVVFLDGDTCPGHAVLERYGTLGARGTDVVIGWRYELSPEETEAFDEAAVRDGEPPVPPRADELAAVDRLERSARWHGRLRPFGLTKAHKPKIIGANHGIRLSALLRVNGYDEDYEGWGREDDDIVRRIYRSGGRWTIAHRALLAYHQWHPTRSDGGPAMQAAIARFARHDRRPGPMRCDHGVDTPLPQPDPSVVRFGPSADGGTSHAAAGGVAAAGTGEGTAI